MLKAKLQAILLAVMTGFTLAEPIDNVFEVPLDHRDENSTTFHIRYIVDDQYFRKPDEGDEIKPKPIFFYCGNEGSVWDFYKNSGFMTTTLAEEYGALVVFGEHRFFGESFPTDDQATAFQPPWNSYLTVEQVLSDYVELLAQIKDDYQVQHKATIAFGGSYGGMLAAWFRMKYPHVIQGALAASAPIRYFRGFKDVDEHGFMEVASQAFNITGTQNDTCYAAMKRAFTILIDQQEQPELIPIINGTFTLCRYSDEALNMTSFVDLLRNGYTYMVMTDYPYPAEFLSPMPAWPVNKSCEAFANYNASTEETDLFAMLNQSAHVYFNWENKTDFCYNLNDTSGTGTLAAGGWNVLACDQMAMPITNGENATSIFSTAHLPFDYDSYSQDCEQQYKLLPQFDWVGNTFGGKFNYQQEYRQYTKIIFSNGGIDPWKAGGVTEYVSPENPVFVMPSGAHHLDLRMPNIDDPEDVNFVREQEMAIIGDWVIDYQGNFDILSGAKFMQK